MGDWTAMPSSPRRGFGQLKVVEVTTLHWRLVGVGWFIGNCVANGLVSFGAFLDLLKPAEVN